MGADGKPRFIVVGGGLAGLMTTIRIAERGYPVDLFSLVRVSRSHSVCAQGGIFPHFGFRLQGLPCGHGALTIPRGGIGGKGGVALVNRLGIARAMRTQFVELRPRFMQFAHLSG